MTAPRHSHTTRALLPHTSAWEGLSFKSRALPTRVAELISPSFFSFFARCCRCCASGFCQAAPAAPSVDPESDADADGFSRLNRRRWIARGSSRGGISPAFCPRSHPAADGFAWHSIPSPPAPCELSRSGPALNPSDDLSPAISNPGSCSVPSRHPPGMN